MLEARQIVVIRENTRFYVTWDAKNAVLLQSQERFLVSTATFSSNSVVEVNLELGPARLNI